MSEKGFRVEIPVSFNRRPLKITPQAPPDREPDDVPRTARLLALAHKWEGMVRRGETNHGQLARQHGLSRARVSQICGLALLCPELQESILEEREVPTKRLLQELAVLPVWSYQQTRWSRHVDPPS